MYYFLIAGSDLGLWLHGPTGCGKTYTVQQFFGRLGLPIVRINVKDVEFEELTGRYELIDGNTRFVQSAMVDVFECGGIIILDEVANMSPDLVEPFFPMLEGDNLTLVRDNGRVVERHPFCRIIGTANTSGQSADMKNYLGAKRQSTAFLDRWSFHAMKSMSQEAEVRSVMAHLELPDNALTLVEEIVSVARAVRGASKLENSGGEVNFTLSSRVVERWVKAAITFSDLDGHIKLGLHYAVAARLTDDELQFLEKTCITIMGHETYEGV